MNCITVTVTEEQMELLNFLKEKGISRSFIIRKALDIYSKNIQSGKKNVRKKCCESIDFNKI